MADYVYMTKEGIAKLRAELDQLRDIERPAAARAIAEARDKGDLSENAEYDAAREAQSMLEMQISRLEATLSKVREIDPTKIDLSQVRLHCRVKMKNTKTNAMMEYTIVAESEADLAAGKISVDTPIAQAIMGKTVGDIVNIKVPIGILSVEIIEIGI